jgi:hypothetical protein
MYEQEVFMAKHLIPSCGPAYDRFFKNITQYVGQMCGGADPVWTHIPLAEWTDLTNAYADWYTGYSRTLKPHLKVDTEAMHAAYDRSKPVLSRFIQVWFRGFPDIVTAEYLANMGIAPIDNKPTPIPKPVNQVEADLTFPGIHMVKLMKIRSVAGSLPDPRSDYGVRIFIGLDGPPSEKYPVRFTKPPKKGREFTYSIFTRKKDALFDLEGESGNAVYFCLQYETPAGGEEGKGPFGPILSAVVP